ncbi:MAG TPA: RNA-binding protein [Bauldia sp.]|nr:RNA-binding protein [Bauldia sp.]
MPRKNEPSERTCVVTREARPVSELLRFAVTPAGAVVPDLKRRLPGRGVWVTATREKVALAVSRHHLERAFDGAVAVDPELPERIDELLVAAALGALSLARKAGAVVAGFGKVEEAVLAGSAIALIHAAEAAPDGVEKLAAAARRRFGPAGLPAVRCFGGDQLDLAFGRSNVIHAALLAGPAGANVLARVQDLFRYRGDDGIPDGSFGPLFDALTDVKHPVRQDIRN